MGVKWRDQEDAFSRLAREEREDYLQPFKGIAWGLFICLPVWLFLGWVIFGR